MIDIDDLSADRGGWTGLHWVLVAAVVIGVIKWADDYGLLDCGHPTESQVSE